MMINNRNSFFPPSTPPTVTKKCQIYIDYFLGFIKKSWGLGVGWKDSRKEKNPNLATYLSLKNRNFKK